MLILGHDWAIVLVCGTAVAAGVVRGEACLRWSQNPSIGIADVWVASSQFLENACWDGSLHLGNHLLV